LLLLFFFHFASYSFIQGASRLRVTCSCCPNKVQHLSFIVLVTHCRNRGTVDQRLKDQGSGFQRAAFPGLVWDPVGWFRSRSQPVGLWSCWRLPCLDAPSKSGCCNHIWFGVRWRGKIGTSSRHLNWLNGCLMEDHGNVVDDSAIFIFFILVSHLAVACSVLLS